MERIEFDDAWWEVRSYYSHGVANQIKLTIQKSFTVLAEHTKNAKLDIDWEQVDLFAVNDTMVLAWTLDWSYGSVNAETLKKVDEKHYQKVLAYVNRLRGEDDPLVGNGARNSAKGSSLRSSVTNLFRRR